MKQKILRVLNILLILSFLLQVVTVLLLMSDMELPGYVFEAHEANGIAMIALIFFHVILNFGWIKMNYLKFLRKKATTIANG